MSLLAAGFAALFRRFVGAPGVCVGLLPAISRKFCRLMGGDLPVTSVEGEGSIFTITLPQTVADPAQPQTTTST